MAKKEVKPVENYFVDEKTFVKEFETRAVAEFARDVKDLSDSACYQILGELIKESANFDCKACKDAVKRDGNRQLIYFSMEFLIGRLMRCNLINMGVYDIVKDGLKALGRDIDKILGQEPDAGLGNGGLGRLAACFMDSIASLGLPGHGNTLRYDYGFFRQVIRNDRQEEVPDLWLVGGNIWETRKPMQAIDVLFYGNAEAYSDPKTGFIRYRTSNAVHVTAIPCDMDIIGYHNHVVNTLRLWTAEPSDASLPSSQNFGGYLRFVKEITHCLYPDDSTEDGKLLRLRQEYFLASAGIQSAIRRHKEVYGDLHTLPQHYVFHLNDSHPIIAIPELIRILIDEEGFSWDDAYKTAQGCFAFTNHTVMQEALEKWPVNYLAQLCPRVYMIIEEINRREVLRMRSEHLSDQVIRDCAIISDGMVRMCNMAVNVCYSVNGVAGLHTEILKKETFHSFYSIMPEKFNNKTNGISHRRFLLAANPELASLLTETVGNDYITDPVNGFKKFLSCQDDVSVLDRLYRIKSDNKARFAAYVKEHNGIEIAPDAIVDTQIKRIHAYKRQTLNILRVIHLYKRMKADPNFRIYPRVFVFGGKAAPSYSLAKNTIELINVLARKVNSDPETNQYLKVVFLENYSVSLAELTIPASDVSEQISTAGKEASGTSNMKFMMNGAITLGTLDGANVEISQLVGPENCVIFGKHSDELDVIRYNGTYNPWNVYNADPRVKQVVDALIDGSIDPNHDRFRQVYDDLMYRGDVFFTLLDFAAYIDASLEIQDRYLAGGDHRAWEKSCLVNIANSGYFSSDRTIAEYNRDIWHLQPIALKK